MLRRAARLLASAADFSDTLRQTIDACLPALGDFGFLDIVHEDGVRRTAAAHEAPDIHALLAPTQWVRQEREDLNLCALSRGHPALHEDIDDGWYRQVATNEGHLELLRALAFGSMITVPVRYRDQLVGALTLFMGRSGRRHTAQDLEFASEFALLVAPVVVNASLLEQHRRAEEALRLGEERLRLAVEASGVGIWDWDILNNRTEWSDRVYEMHGMPVGTGPGGIEAFQSRVHPDDWPRVGESMATALAGGARYAAEFRTVLPGGRIRWIWTQGHLVRGADGKPRRMVGASIDVTQRNELLQAEREARAQAEAANRRLELLAQAGELLSQSLAPDETLQAIARTLVPAIADWCRIDVFDDAGVLQRAVAHHLDPERARHALQMAREMSAASETKGALAWVLSNGKPHYGSYRSPEALADASLRKYTGTFGMHAHFILPLVARGRILGVMAVIQAESGRDIPEADRAVIEELGQRASLALDNARLYAQAESALAQAESANRAKDEFLAMLGHELRNPLAPIATALELMQRDDSGGGERERKIIGRQVKHLSRLIDDLLDISRITQGKIQIHRDAVDLRAVIVQALELTRPVFEQHARPVDVRTAQAPAVVEGDATRLCQILCNLLVNAAKFTPPRGRVSLTLEPGADFHELVVEDEGCGIAPALLPRVFDLFVQSPQSIDRSAGGLGLGLAIVRSLTELHGGTVHVHSAGEGQGCRFTVRLPASRANVFPGEAPKAVQANGSGRILVVDDNLDAADTLADLLRMTGYEARTAGDARMALAVIDEFAPALALLDIGLPGINGYELAGMIRGNPRCRDMKLVALTGYGRDNDRARALHAGFDEHLIKPVDFEKLLKVLGNFLTPVGLGKAPAP